MNVYRELRENYKIDGKTISLRALSKKLGIGFSHISEIENGIKKPSINVMRKYHDFFGVTMDYLIGEDADGIVASSEDVKYAIKTVQNKETSEDILKKQTVEFLFGTNPGKAILYQLSEILFGVEDLNKETGTYVSDERNELHRITHESIEDRSKQLVNELIMLRDPKYRKASYNEVRVISENCKSMALKDEYSKKALQ